MLPIQNERTAYWLLGKGTPFEFTEVSETIIQDALKNRTGIYYTVNQLGDTRNKNGNLRDKENVVAFNASFVDMDDGAKAEQMAKLHSSPIVWSSIVESGRGYHAYFAYEVPEPNTPESSVLWRTTQETLATYFGGDHACKDTARLMRLPGSWHVRDNMEPSIVRIVEESGFVYSLAEVAEAFNVTLPVVRPVDTGTFYLSDFIPNLHPVTLHINNRHPSLVNKAAFYLAKTPSMQYAERVRRLKSWYMKSCVVLKDDWEAEVEEVCAWVAKNQWGHIPPL